MRNGEGELADGITLDEQVCVVAHTVEQDFVTFLHELADFFTEGIGFDDLNNPELDKMIGEDAETLRTETDLVLSLIEPAAAAIFRISSADFLQFFTLKL